MMNWIRMNKHLHDVLEVIQISDILDIEVACTVGHLHRFWSFVDDNSVDGRISLSEGQVDKLTRPGFATALLLVDWLHGESRDFTVPNFERYNPNPGKGRNVPQAHRTPAPLPGDSPQPSSELGPKRKGRVGGKDPKTGRYTKSSTGPNTGPDMEFTGHQFLDHMDDLLVNLLDNSSSKSPEAAPAKPSCNAGSSSNGPVQYSTRRDRRKEMYWEGGTCTASPPDFSFFAKIAKAKSISMDFAQLFYTGLKASNFKDSNGQGIQNYAGYFVASAKRWTTQEPKIQRQPAPARVEKPMQAWQIERDLATMEGRLKTLQGSWRPDPDLIKALNDTKKRLQAELRVALQTENQTQ